MPGVAYDLYLKECPEGNSNFLNTNIRIEEAVVKKGELCGMIDRGY